MHQKLFKIEVQAKSPRTRLQIINALLTVCPAWVSSEIAFSISRSIVVRRRSGLKDETIVNLCFPNTFFIQEK